MRYDLQKLKSALPESGYFVEGGLYYFPEIDSTNSWLLSQDQVAGKFCLAETQIAGRGRHPGRVWEGVAGGSVLLSMAWDLSTLSDKPKLDGLSLVSGVAVIEALKRQQADGLMLKWPNDVFVEINQRFHKLGGILVEIQGNKLVIGIGLNINLQQSSDLAIDQNWTDLVTLGFDLSREKLVADLLSEHSLKIGRCLTEGFGVFRDHWNRLHAFNGRTIYAESLNERICGVALGVDDKGVLLVQTDSDIQRIRSGEVSICV